MAELVHGGKQAEQIVKPETRNLRESPKDILRKWTEAGKAFFHREQKIAESNPKEALSDISKADPENLLEKKEPKLADLSETEIQEYFKIQAQNDRLKELDQKIEQSKDAVEYPDKQELKEVPTDEQVAASVEKYTSWRKAHEDVEGVREPERAKILCHATSIEGAKNVLIDGELKSIKSLLCSDNPRADVMNGGKAKYISGETHMMVEKDPQLQQLVLERRQQLLDYCPWIEADKRKVFSERLAVVDNIDGLMVEVRGLIDDGLKKGFWPNHTSVLHPPWNYITNLLPKDVRRRIADQARVEDYISTTLGHALEGYTSGRGDPSRQAAVVTIDVADIPREQMRLGGGTDRFRKIDDLEWDYIVKKTAELPSKIKNFESTYGGDATEISILNDNPEGTSVRLENNAVVLMPNSKKDETIQQFSQVPDRKANLQQIIWFDDSKFRSIDEALGWLVTTPEGKALYKSKVNLSSTQS